MVQTVSPEALLTTTNRKLSSPISLALRHIFEEQRRDPNLKQIKQALKSSQNVKGEFGIINNALHKNSYDPTMRWWLLVIPKHLRLDILRQFHDTYTTGRLGFVKFCDRIRR